MDSREELWFLDTGWGCGGVFVRADGVIVGGAPIFQKLRGRSLYSLPPKYVRIRVG